MFVYSSRLAAMVVARCDLCVVEKNGLWSPAVCGEEHIVNLARQQSHFIETLRGIARSKFLAGKICEKPNG